MDIPICLLQYQDESIYRMNEDCGSNLPLEVRDDLANASARVNDVLSCSTTTLSVISRATVNGLLGGGVREHGGHESGCPWAAFGMLRVAVAFWGGWQWWAGVCVWVCQLVIRPSFVSGCLVSSNEGDGCAC